MASALLPDQTQYISLNANVRNLKRKAESMQSSFAGNRLIPNRAAMHLDTRSSLEFLNIADKDLCASAGGYSSRAINGDCETNNENDSSYANMGARSSMTNANSGSDSSGYETAAQSQSNNPTEKCSDMYLKAMEHTFGMKKQRILAFSSAQVPQPANACQSAISSLEEFANSYEAQKLKLKSKDFRYIPTAPVRILDAPDIVDDFYLNPIDWGANNILAVALSNVVYLWNAEKGDIQQLCELSATDADPEPIVTSVKFSDMDFNTLAVGTSSNTTRLYDISSGKILRKFRAHTGRVSTVSWNQHCVTTGSKDSAIYNNDVRIKDHLVNKFVGHCQEICSLSWSQCGSKLASGGNDNLVNIYDIRKNVKRSNVDATSGISEVLPMFSLTDHKAAVKAISFSPFYQNILASGGGTGCRAVKLWNVQTGQMVSSTQTSSAISSLMFNPFENEILTSHSGNKFELSLWRYPTMTKCKDLLGHEQRILKTVLSPCGKIVCSAGADETLRFWKVFDVPPKSKKEIALENKTPEYIKLKIR